MLRSIAFLALALLAGCTVREWTPGPEEKFKANPGLASCFDNGGEEYKLRPTDKSGGECTWRKKR